MNFAIVAAAGRSSRLGRSKAMLPLADSRVIDVLLGRLTAGGVERTVVVAAAGDRPLAARCAELGVDLAVNASPERGMLSSIWVGLERIAQEANPSDAVLICPVDFPAVAATTVAVLLAAVRAPATEVAVPSFAGRRGHPLALRATVIDGVLRLDPEVGLRQLLGRQPYREVAVDDAAIHLDLDTWRDHARLEAACSGGELDGR